MSEPRPTTRGRHLVDPELLPLVDAYPTIELSDELLPLLRGTSAPLPGFPDATATVDRRQLAVPGPTGTPDVALNVYTPRGAVAPLPCVYHVHGGGFIAGSAAAVEPINRPLAAEVGAVIVSVDYRLAPETRFPGAIEDCYAGLAGVMAHAAELGIDPARVAVMGESAGGGLAAALALLVRDRGEHRLIFQHLAYPMLDDRTCTSEPHPFAGEFFWTRHNSAYGWSALLGVPPGSDGVSPYAAAARATDLSGLPPAFISSSALDLFLEEDVEYARRLVRAGVPVELHVYPGAWHAFDVFTDSRVALAARRDAREHCAASSGPGGAPELPPGETAERPHRPDQSPLNE
jgi:acetyl esterase/lipase